MKRVDEAASSAPPAAAAVAPPGLVYVSDEAPGYSRHRRGKGFVYRRPDGTPLRDPASLSRIRALAIPPAYTQVWICALEQGHLQATGRDARGRKQYRYHPAWRAARDAHKFDRLLEFAAALPRIRARVKRDLGPANAQPVRRDAVLATIVRLLDTTMVRVGNDEYARSNGSFGLTTLRRRHAAVTGSRLRLRFRGKSGVPQEVAVDDPNVARIVRRCQTLPGQELFQYLDDDGEPHSIGSADVNDYLREASGGDFTAKDFRTWHGSVHALALAGQPAEAAEGTPASRAKQVLSEVASRLGNTVAVCRKAYVHPRVLALLLGEAEPGCGAAALRKISGSTGSVGLAGLAGPAGLSRDERRFVAFLSPPRAAHKTRKRAASG